MARLVFSFAHGDDALKERMTGFYVRAIERTKELFSKAVIPDTAIAQRTWIKLQEYPLGSIEAVFGGTITAGFVIARREHDTKESVSTRLRAGLADGVLNAIKDSIDFEMGLFPEDITTPLARTLELIPRRDDPDESKMIYRNLIAESEISSWWYDIDLLVAQMVDMLVEWMDPYLDSLMILPEDVTYDTSGKASHEDYFKIYVPYRF